MPSSTASPPPLPRCSGHSPALLDVARLDAGAVIDRSRARFSLDELLGALRIKFALVAAAKWPGARHSREWPGAGGTDPALLESILGNLLRPTRWYTTVGSVSLTARRQDQLLELQVRDTGPGIAAGQHKRIFEEFVHLEPAGAGGGGVGLGLAISAPARRTVGRARRCRVRRGRGQRVHFAVRLPFVPGEAMAQVPRPVGPTPDLAGLRILVLDHDPLVLEATASEVADWGARPLPALNASAAMAVMTDLAPGVPDGAIIDQDIIGEMSGVALLDRIGARFGVALPAVIVTGEASAGAREELIDSGHPWLLKPADLGERCAGCWPMRSPRRGCGRCRGVTASPGLEQVACRSRRFYWRNSGRDRA